VSRLCCAAFWLTLLVCVAAHGHESRPGYLEINETGPGRYAVNWKVPRRGDLVMPLKAVLPDSCTDLVPMMESATPGAFLQQRRVDCGTAGLDGLEVRIDGLTTTITDVLARVTLLDGSVQTELLKPDATAFTVAGEQTAFEVFSAYLVLGIEHILLGIDHLLFVLCLLLIVRSLRLLVETITAFTLAHSVTLGLAALGFVHVPQAPVEAIIALSILFLASELVRQHDGKEDLTQRYPWLVALSFGLLHGFGFAGALSEIGLPQGDIPLALFSFNAGVELGQLIFVAVVLAVMALLRRVPLRWPEWVQLAPAYSIGGIAAFWTIQRIAGF
jgi:hydrogenase/urease accessory protein HupE